LPESGTAKPLPAKSGFSEDDTLSCMSTWQAPPAAGPVSARVRPPGSKSITNRALVLAALSSGPSAITGGLDARDTQLAVAALRALDASVIVSRTDWRFQPGDLSSFSGAVSSGAASSGAVDVDLGNSGTCMRFLPAVAALTSASVRFDGDPRIRERPNAALLGALRILGAVVDGDAAPFTVHGHGSVPGGTVTLDASGSSQLVSGLLLAGPRFRDGLSVRHEGPPVPSAPHIVMTVRMLRAAGATVTVIPGPDGRPCEWQVTPGPLSLGAVAVEPDLSNAVPFLAAALVTGGTVVLPGWPADSLQASSAILDALCSMGATCSVDDSGLTISGTGTVRGASVDLRDVSEMAPVLTAVAAVASSPSVFTGLAHTRTHETDRLAAMAKEINALGGDVSELPDGLEVRPRPLRASGTFHTYDDHRLVMAAAVLGLAVPGLLVDNVETVGKTFPGFTDAWASMLSVHDEPGVRAESGVNTE
jgi:3-phosphoshikimate 1-carboxyvinyltransferase